MHSDFSIQPSFENKQAIVFCLNNNFVKYFGVTLFSLIENSSEEKSYDIVVINRDITEKNKKRLLKLLPDNFSLRFFNIDEFIKSSFKDISLPTNGSYWSIDTYYRIFIPLIMQGYEKVLYLDSDTIINRNLDEIFNIDFDNKKVMACRDTFVIKSHRQKDNMRLDYIKNTLKIKNIQDYVNTGVMLLNISAIDPEKYFNDLIEIFNNVKTFLYADQEILNSIFYGQIKFLPFEYNCQIGYIFRSKGYEDSLLEEYKTNFLNAQKNPIIIHYTTDIKPWNCLSEFYQTELTDIYWHYARKTVFYEENIFSLVNNKQKEKKKSSEKSTPIKKQDEYSFFEKIFSVKNAPAKGYIRKVITVLGIKMSFRVKLNRP